MILTIGILQNMKGRMVVKWNSRKSRIIFPRENEHLVLFHFFQDIFWKLSSYALDLWLTLYNNEIYMIAPLLEMK